MLKEISKQNIKNPLNLLWFILLPVSWYLGTGIIRQNIEFLTNNPLMAQNPVAAEAFAKQAQAINGYMVFAEGISKFYVALAAVLLAGLIFSSGFAYDKNTGFGNLCLTRTAFAKYFTGKVFSNFVCVFLFTTLSLLIPFGYSLIKYSATTPTADFNFSMINEASSKVFFGAPVWSCFLMIITVALYAALFSLIGMGFSLFTSNRFLLCASPLAIYIFVTLFPQLFSTTGAFAKILAWIFPSYITGIFINNNFFYIGSLSFAAVWLIHFAILFIAASVLLTLLYKKNKKQYIK